MKSPGSPSVKALLQWGITELRNCHIETSRLDAEVLLAQAMGKDRLQLYLSFEQIADEGLKLRYRLMIKSRSARMPVSYITGHREFMSLDFVVNEDVLIPRPETEILVETISKCGKPGDRILELGTGSGAIAVSLAKHNSDWHIVATDLSMKALLVAQINARHHGVLDRISFVQTDLFEALSSLYKFGWVVSNPPYIPRRDLAHLPAGIRNYEPMLALDGGPDGLDVIRRILAEAWMMLQTDGGLAIEIGNEQSADIQKIAANTGKYSDCSVVEDYFEVPRVLYWSRRGENSDISKFQ